MTKDHDLIYRRAALELLETSADLIRRALDCTDLVGAERDKFEWGFGLIEPLIYDMESLPPVDIREQSVDIGYLYEWYQDSVDPDDEPVWTKKHIEEIFHDFYLIPKQEGEDG